MKTINSLPSFLDSVGSLAKSWSPPGNRIRLWFRGQNSSRWSLKPSLYRKVSDYPRDVEEHYRVEYRIRGPQIVEGRNPADDWEWYYLMQHFGFPTRLIDWTDSALIALYFAIRAGKGNGSAGVWVLDPRWLNELAISKSSIATSDWPDVADYLPPIGRGVPLPRYPVAIDPVHVTRRLSAQRGHFTVHGRDTNALDSFRKKGSTSKITKLIIPERSFKAIEYELACCGVVETLLFPDLEGLSRELLKELII